MGISLEEFKKRLQGGEYEKAGNARRALGKAMEIQGEDRAKANRMIDRHFEGGDSAPVPAKKAPSEGKSAAKAEPKKRGRKPKAEVVSGTVSATATGEAEEKQLELFSRPSAFKPVLEGDSERIQKLLFLERVMAAAVSGYQAAAALPATYSDVVSGSVQGCADLLTDATAQLRKLVEQL